MSTKEEPAWTHPCIAHAAAYVQTRSREMHQNKHTVHLPHIKAASREAQLSSDLHPIGLPQKDPLGPAHASPMRDSQTT